MITLFSGAQTSGPSACFKCLKGVLGPTKKFCKVFTVKFGQQNEDLSEYSTSIWKPQNLDFHGKSTFPQKYFV